MEIFKIYPFVLAHDFFRYFIAAGLGYMIFWVVWKKKWQHRIIQQKMPQVKKMWFEFRYSMSTVVIFSCVGFSIVVLEKAGYTTIYQGFGEYGWSYFIFSFFLMLILHDTYFYWVHRLMHHPKLFKHVHLVHHRSTNPSPWAAYSFHPIEALLEAGIYLIFVFSFPVSDTALLFFVIFMIVKNVQGHLGIEFLPKWFLKSKLVNWTTTTTHHDLHHKKSNTNYGLYFTWWDDWMGTTDKTYEQTFDEVTTRSKTTTSLKKAVNVLLMLPLTLPLTGQSPVGLWKTFDEKTGHPLSLIEIKETPKGLSGHVAKIYLRPWQGTDPICSECRGENKNKKVVGMHFLWDFSQKKDHWTNGKILDPASGDIYKSKMWLEQDTLLKVRGYAGPLNLFYRTQDWYLHKADQDGNPYTGVWKTIDDYTEKEKALVKIYLQKGHLKGEVIKIFADPTESNPPCKACPGIKKNQPIVQMEILWAMLKKEDKWQGKIMDPGNGKIYTGALWLETPNTLKVRGYWGPFYRTQKWQRVEVGNLSKK